VNDDGPVPRLSLVIPTYNEGGRIERTLLRTLAYLKAMAFPFEVIVVDNRSLDGTAATVGRIANEERGAVRLVVEDLPGKGSAVRCGVLRCRGEFVVFMDADCATPISEIERFWPAWDAGADVVVGSRYVASSVVVRPQPWLRRLLSRIGNAIVRAVAVRGIFDTQAGFKGFRGDVARDLFGRLRTTGWAFDVELLAIARQAGYQVVEVGVEWREPGGSHLPARAYLTALMEVLRIRWWIWRGAYGPNAADARRAPRGSNER
jgi:dolichyl-phosphate beta-glucosyltransferase